jgi:DNA-binding SARP family transcriptional activator
MPFCYIHEPFQGVAPVRGLELRLLGEVEVVRDGKVLALPPSRKTRALLAYLALRGRPSGRDHLCELLWELPDDPRGSLRWSLSKLRRLVDEDDRPRIVADRNQVRFDPEGVAIDVKALCGLVDEGLESVSTEALEEASVRYQGNFLEGLELTQLHAFYAWCVSERDRVARAQAALLQALIERLAATPERALPHARALVVRSPYDEALRADLIRLLVRSGRADEAEQQLRMGERLLAEIGRTSQGLLAEARHEVPPRPPAREPTPRVRATPMASLPEEAATVASASHLLVGRESETAQLLPGQAGARPGRARDREESPAGDGRRARARRRRLPARSQRLRVRGDPALRGLDRRASPART